LRSSIQLFSQVHNTIPHISNASVVVAFRQDVRDEKMLEKLATHNIQDVAELFSLANKCAKATEGHACHVPPTPDAGNDDKPEAGTAAQGGGGNKNKDKKKKKATGNNQPLAGALTVAAAAAAAGWGHGPRDDTNTPIKRSVAMTVAPGARCTTPHDTPLDSARKSRSSRNSTLSN
jgi:hypothetical protein